MIRGSTLLHDRDAAVAERRWELADRWRRRAAAAARWMSPLVDLAIRLALAQVFLSADLVRAMAPARHPVLEGAALLFPGMAGHGFALSFWVGAVLLLAIGAATRLAALTLLLQLLLDRHLPAGGIGVAPCWGLLLGWLALLGPGTLSIDAMIGAGVRASALPFASTGAKIIRQVTIVAAPWIRLVVRLWVAILPIAVVLASSDIAMVSTMARMAPGPAWVPRLPSMFVVLPSFVLFGLACAIALGLFTRLASLALMLAAAVPSAAAAGVDRLWWVLLLALPVLHGPGRVAFDRLLLVTATAHRRDIAARAAARLGELAHVVIVGGGFGGIAAARSLASASCRVTIVDANNYHLFQPLLYQVATAGLSPADIATPIREVFRDQPNVRVLLGRIDRVDPVSRQVGIGSDLALSYDFLVLATGARHSYLGHDEWAGFAPGLKGIEDAIEIRQRLLFAFEQAESSEDPVGRKAWLSFVIIGGGPTGVELAGALAELAREGLSREFRNIDPATARVVLVQSGSRLLPAFPERLSLAAARSLEALGVEVRTDSRVAFIDAAGVKIGTETIPARTVLWAAGVAASPAGSWLSAATDRSGRLCVGPDLSVPGHERVFAIGDLAFCEAWSGRPVPGLAPAARQGGQYVGRVIQARLQGEPPPPPFRYRHLGSLATIGRRAAVAEFGRLRIDGPPAWWLWGAAHVIFLVGTRNRLSVVTEWLWAYLTLRRSTRLLTVTQKPVAVLPPVRVAP